MKIIFKLERKPKASEMKQINGLQFTVTDDGRLIMDDEYAGVIDLFRRTGLIGPSNDWFIAQRLKDCTCPSCRRPR